MWISLCSISHSDVYKFLAQGRGTRFIDISCETRFICHLIWIIRSKSNRIGYVFFHLESFVHLNCTLNKYIEQELADARMNVLHFAYWRAFQSKYISFRSKRYLSVIINRNTLWCNIQSDKCSRYYLCLDSLFGINNCNL